MARELSGGLCLVQLRRRFGRGDTAEPGQRDRTVAAAIDGVGHVLVPILAVWLIGKLLAATSPPAPINLLLPELICRALMLPQPRKQTDRSEAVIGRL